jgi:hypothetical protein
LNNQTISILDVNKGKRVVITSTLPGYLGKASFLGGFPLTNTIAKTFRRKTADKNKNGFISAEESFRNAKPRAMLKSSLFWFSTWVINCFQYKLLKYSYPILRSTLSLIISYVFLQLYVYKESNHYLLNSPNMIDDYDGELSIIQN